METKTHSHPLYHRDRNGKLTGSWTTTLTPYGLKVECRECGQFYGYEPFEAANLPWRPDFADAPGVSCGIRRLNAREYAFHPANTPRSDEP